MMHDLRYLSHGKKVTGGYLHELFLFEEIARAMQLDPHRFIELRQWRMFESPSQYLQLFQWAFKNGKAPLVVTVSRLAIPVLLRNILNRNQVLVVWHYHHSNDGHQSILHAWYRFTFWLIRILPEHKVKLVAVAPYWVSYFKQKVGNDKVVHYPNFIDPISLNEPKDQQRIHLGQWSGKNSSDLFWLASELHARGRQCYFSTNLAQEAAKHESYEVIYFKNHVDYLKEMAGSAYTLAMPDFPEGWNRVAHESLLCGTQVIGYALGGLGDLLHGANAYIVNNREEALKTVLECGSKTIQQAFLINHYPDQQGNFLQGILDWIALDKDSK